MLRNTRSRTVFSFQHHSLCEDGQSKQKPTTIVKKKSLSKLTSAAETLGNPWSQSQLTASERSANTIGQVPSKLESLQRVVSEAALPSGRSKASGEGSARQDRSVPMSPAGTRAKPPSAPPALPSFPSNWKTNPNEPLRPVKSEDVSTEVSLGSATWPSARWKNGPEIGSPHNDKTSLRNDTSFTASPSLDAALAKSRSPKEAEDEDAPIRIDAKAPPMLSRSKSIPWQSWQDDAEDSLEQLKKPSWFAAKSDLDVSSKAEGILTANGTATSSEITSPAPRRSNEESALSPSSFSLPEKRSSGRSPKRRPEVLLECVVGTPEVGGSAPTPSAGSQQSPRSIPAQSPLPKTDGTILGRTSPRAAKVLSSPRAVLQNFSPRMSPQGQAPSHGFPCMELIGQTSFLHSQAVSVSNERPPMLASPIGQHSYGSSAQAPGASLRKSSHCSSISYDSSSAGCAARGEVLSCRTPVAVASPSSPLLSPNASKVGTPLFQTTTTPKFSLVQQCQASVNAGFQKTQMASGGTQCRLFTTVRSDLHSFSDDVPRKFS